MSKIKLLKAFEILDSRENPTISVECTLDSEFVGKASIPSGASTGSHEALELRDKDLNYHNGYGVNKAINLINSELNDLLINKDFNQSTLDAELIKLDGTRNKSRFGSNSILGISIAFARAVALERGQELFEYLGDISGNSNFKMPTPLFNIINGGKHAKSGLDIQEFMIMPTNTSSFKESFEIAKKIVPVLRQLLNKNNFETSLGDEGGFAPKLKDNDTALVYITEAIKSSNYDFDKVKIAIDCAANSFYKDGLYEITTEGKTEKIDSSTLTEYYLKLVTKFPIVSIEDPFMEEDWQSFSNLLSRLDDGVNVVGDDLTVTNIERINTAKDNKSINTVIIKPNQIGTLTETINAVKMVKDNNWKSFASHRSGETMDTFIADIAVGLGCDYIKSGSVTKPERICKYERLLEIENKIKIV